MHGDRVVVRLEGRDPRPERADERRPQAPRRPSADGPRRGPRRPGARARLEPGRRPLRRSTPSGLGYVVPFDKKILVDIQVQPTETKGAQPGEMVTVAITRWPTPTRGPAGRIVEVLGDIDAPGVDLQVIIRKYGIHDAHGDAAVAEATRLGVGGQAEGHRGPHRLPRRCRPSPSTARTPATSTTRSRIERLPNGHYWLGVHIADVSHYVREGSALDDRGLRARHVGLLPRARRAHVPARARRPGCARSTRRSIASCSRA